jgi:hypothetical protein
MGLESIYNEIVQYNEAGLVEAFDTGSDILIRHAAECGWSLDHCSTPVGESGLCRHRFNTFEFVVGQFRFSRTPQKTISFPPRSRAIRVS